ncbi:carbohydrate porin [Acidithiobacillus sp. IBUN Pt1247-S3]|uniref:carbohydrate porin n=1 Tax=Acidithiobacillus sp. IBUN Pt1247-S3 TaxID=3166642 RepID=UPI0034E54467
MPVSTQRIAILSAAALASALCSLPVLASSKVQSIPETTHQPWENGLSLVNHLDIESVSNLRGGLAQGTTAAGLWKGGLGLHTGRAGWWSGGLFLVEGLVANSGAPNSLYVGDLQGVSNLTTPYVHIARLYKAYYRQNLGPNTLRIGLINRNDYFNVTGVAGDLFNASFGIYPTITANIPYTPTYPYSSLGVMAAGQWGGTTIQTGVFGADGVHPYRRPWGADGSIWYGEIDQSLKLGPGQMMLKAGGYYSQVSGSYLTQNIGIGPAPSQGGFYGTGEYRWRSSGMQWGAFLQGSAAPNVAAVSPINAYLGAGLRLRHFLPAVPKATLSLGMARAWQRQQGAETSLEINWRQPLSHGLYISPDLQYIINPGANVPGSRLANALVAIVRLGWDYSLKG